MRRAIWWTSLGLRLLVVGIVMLGAGFDWHWFSSSVAQKTREALGRPVVIEGNLEVDWTWPPLIRAEQVRVANAPWSTEPFMLEIRRLACRIDLQALLRGRLVLPMIELVEPVVRLVLYQDRFCQLVYRL
jgi:AsmA family protein